MLRTKRESIHNLPALSFLLTAALVLLLYALRGITPFGDGTLMFSDAGTQYVSIWSYFRDAILGRQDWAYALEKTLGGSTAALFSYYAASPFNLLFLLFPAERMPLAFSLIVLLKLSCCSLTLAFFLRDGERSLRPFSLVYTSAYALCGYCTSFFWSAMWLDGVLLLPLVALGLRRLRQGRPPWLYLFSLAAAIFANFYTGFMLCLFSVLYDLFLLLADGNWRLRVSLRFGLASLAAGGLCAFQLLPALWSMRDGKQAPFLVMVSAYYGEMAERNARRFGLPLSTGSFLVLLLLGLGALLALLLLFCFRSRAPYGWKLAALFVLPLLLVARDLLSGESFFLHQLLFGAEDYPSIFTGLPKLYVGLVTLPAAALYFLRPAGRERERLGAALLLMLLLGSMRFFVPNLIWHGFTKNICFNFRYSFVFCFFLLTLANEAPVPRLPVGRAAAWVLAAVQLASLLFPANATIRNLQSYFHPSAAAFRASIQTAREALGSVEAADDGLYRLSFNREINGPLQYGFNGVTSFSSTASRSDVAFLQRLGLTSDNLAWVSGVYGRSDALDTLLGVRWRTDGDNTSWSALPGSDFFENPAALPLLFPADADVLTTAVDSSDAIANLNRLFRALCPSLDLDVYHAPTVLERRVQGLDALGDDRYQGEGEIAYRLRTEAEGPLYLWLADGRDKAAQVLVNDSPVAELADPYSWHILSLGRFEAKEELTITLRAMPETGQEMRDRPCFGTEDADALRAFSETLRAPVLSVQHDSDTHFLCRLHVEERQVLLFTVPWDSAWRAEIDGKPAATASAFGYFLAVPLNVGTHTVSLHYATEGLGAGLILSGLSLACVLAVLLYRLRRRKRRHSPGFYPVSGQKPV